MELTRIRAKILYITCVLLTKPPPLQAGWSSRNINMMGSNLTSVVLVLCLHEGRKPKGPHTSWKSPLNGKSNALKRPWNRSLKCCHYSEHKLNVNELHFSSSQIFKASRKIPGFSQFLQTWTLRFDWVSFCSLFYTAFPKTKRVIVESVHSLQVIEWVVVVFRVFRFFHGDCIKSLKMKCNSKKHTNVPEKRLLLDSLSTWEISSLWWQTHTPTNTHTHTRAHKLNISF